MSCKFDSELRDVQPSSVADRNYPVVSNGLARVAAGRQSVSLADSGWPGCSRSGDDGKVLQLVPFGRLLGSRVYMKHRLPVTLSEHECPRT